MDRAIPGMEEDQKAQAEAEQQPPKTYDYLD